MSETTETVEPDEIDDLDGELDLAEPSPAYTLDEDGGLVLGDEPDVMDLPESERVKIFTDRYGQTYWMPIEVPMSAVMEYKRLAHVDRDAAYSTLIVDLLGEPAWQEVRKYPDAVILKIAENILKLFPEKAVTRPNRAKPRKSGSGRRR